jgi:hypothetical protein
MRQAVASMVFAGLLAVTAGNAVSQPMSAPGPFVRGTGSGMIWRGDGQSDPASYLDRLKTVLGITLAQEPAWNDYTDTVKGVAWQMQRVHQMMHDVIDTATARERRAMMNRVLQARQRSFDMVHGAAEELLAALEPTQRTKAADRLPGLSGPGYGTSGARTP